MFRNTLRDAQIESWARELNAICVYFDNDQAGYAAANALLLKRMAIGRRSGRNVPAF